jgi:hypothetical protein
MQGIFASIQLGMGSRRTRVPLFAIAAMLATASISKADLFVVDGDVVDRFNSSTGAVIQTNGNDTFANLDSATGVTVGPDGSVYVANTNPGFDPNLAVVNRYNATTGQQIGGAFIPFANDASQLDGAEGIAFGPDGNFYVADELDNGPVKAFDSNGNHLTNYDTVGGNAEAVAFDPALPGDIFVATGSTIEQINLSTHQDNIIVQGDSDTFSNGSDLAFGPDGKLYVLDTSGSTPQILRYNADGTGQTVFTNFSSPSFSPAIFEPADMAFGPDGHLYVSGLSLESLNSQQGEILQLSDDGSTSNEFVTNLNAPGFIAFTAVPEPTSLLLCAGSLIFLGGRRFGKR